MIIALHHVRKPNSSYNKKTQSVKDAFTSDIPVIKREDIEGSSQIANRCTGLIILNRNPYSSAEKDLYLLELNKSRDYDTGFTLFIYDFQKYIFRDPKDVTYEKLDISKIYD